jgi:hypothetical protein
MAEMTESVRTLALAGLRQRYPADTHVQRRSLADLLLGPELDARAHGPPPEEGECYPNSSRAQDQQILRVAQEQNLVVIQMLEELGHEKSDCA